MSFHLSIPWNPLELNTMPELEHHVPVNMGMTPGQLGIKTVEDGAKGPVFLMVEGAILEIAKIIQDVRQYHIIHCSLI